nr:piggyBac transposable element-derived protein 3-like [Onthophagus taurus]
MSKANTSWYLNKVLTDEEFLVEAAKVCVELENLPLDNSEQTDIEDEEDDIVITSASEISMLEDEEVEQLTNQNEESDTDVVEIRGKGPEKKNKAEIDRKWRKREKKTEIPGYDYPEEIIGDTFATCNNPTDYFLTLMSNCVKEITFQSNLNVTQRNKTLNLKEEELLCFIGKNFLMGYHSLPSYELFWSNAEDLGVPLVVRTMTRNKFQEILSYLHVNDNSIIPKNNTDKLYKIRLNFKTLNRQLCRYYHGTSQLVVDESMIIFKGRSSVKQLGL